ncbi:MAG: hypothetical protein GX050_06290 [Firmicutes bacterium]|nr:hypothetical protein [Bacillota bacterium]
MERRVLAIVSFLVRFYADWSGEGEREKAVVDDLLKEGFALEEINTALTLFLGQPEKIEDNPPEKPAHRPFWIFSDAVSRKTSPQLRAELLRYYNGSYLTLEEMADLVHACIYSPKDEVKLSDLPALVNGVIKDPLRCSMLLSAATREEEEQFSS